MAPQVALQQTSPAAAASLTLLVPPAALSAKWQQPALQLVLAGGGKHVAGADPGPEGPQHSTVAAGLPAATGLHSRAVEASPG